MTSLLVYGSCLLPYATPTAGRGHSFCKLEFCMLCRYAPSTAGEGGRHICGIRRVPNRFHFVIFLHFLVLTALLLADFLPPCG